MSIRLKSKGASTLLASVVLLTANAAHASFLSGEALDTAADALSWFILLVMPPAAIVLFWMVHVLPQKAAEKRHHPQKEAIHVLCLLSLVFGGLLWPFAWLWAYTRPSIVAMSTGTEKHEDYFFEAAERAERGELPAIERERVVAELGGLESRGLLTVHLREARDRLLAVDTPDGAVPQTDGAA
jgi:CBS domain containing-hemolysin-like protein